MKISLKCDTQGCHRRKKVSLEEIAVIKAEGAQAGQRVGLICPACVKTAFDSPDQYELDIPLGELAVEAVRETPRWRICFMAEGVKAGTKKVSSPLASG
jgi:hypothetical protein